MDSVWNLLDREYLASVASRRPTPVFATVSGAHLYGFASPDSDVDLRGAFMHPATTVLGLHPPDETFSLMDQSRIDLDWVAHDIRKFARLMTQHNGYVLEQLFSPLVVLQTPAFEELKELGRGCFTRPTVRHYKGFAQGRRNRLREPDPTVKHLLYAYRVYLTGIHLMSAHEIESNILRLNERFNLPQVNDLVQRKRHGTESMPLDADEIEEHDKHLAALEEQLDRAQEASELPHEPTSSTALDAFVVRLRLSNV